MDFLPAPPAVRSFLPPGGAPLPENAVMTPRCRVALDDGLRVGVTELQEYAVSQPTEQQAGMTTAKAAIAS
ncbi:hypothetical protein ACFUJR_11365 [Streptomyces sp. NPDC057271]|uniref:hypothetical protein n=1 Tax=unclassified Streptomyces TaxID=2593676 RepID=UPI00363AA8A8